MAPEPASAPQRDGRGLAAHTTEAVNPYMFTHAVNAYISTRAVNAYLPVHAGDARMPVQAVRTHRRQRRGTERQRSCRDEREHDSLEPPASCPAGARPSMRCALSCVTRKTPAGGGLVDFRDPLVGEGLDEMCILHGESPGCLRSAEPLGP